MQDLRNNNGEAQENRLAVIQSAKPPALFPQAGAVAAATESVKDIITASKLHLESVMAEVSKTLKDCDAELNATEKINIIFEEGRTVFSIERSVNMGQERSRW